MENVSWLIILSLCASLVNCLDLGPVVRIAQCRSQCLKRYSTDGTCDWFSSRPENICSECWQNCEAVEKRWEETSKTICEGEHYTQCPACQIACSYRKTRVAEKYLPSMLPAPKKGPINLDNFDVAIVMRKVHKQWKDTGYYPGGRVPNLRPDTWIIVVTEQGMKQYSWQEWVPTLECLKEGLLYEATVSWKDVSIQLRKQQDLEQKRFNDRVRQFFLEKYGEKVLTEWRSQEDSQISEEVFRRFFFRRKDERNDEVLEADGSPSTNGNSFEDLVIEKDGFSKKKESYIVSWEPETGGLIGNQVTDSNSVQISLFPGTKYLVRIASNEGPGSFPIEVDTRPGSIQVKRVKRNFQDLYPWDVSAACISAVIIIFAIIIAKFLRKKKKINVEDV
ncbi:uncharacterized protein LOC118449309 [Vespa mandarinia]|uniref:uncharacterized protein LOC118449309 n=1 Tax=Vespa mandarinia TaxID=7446 RepID=UPI001616E11C|nr:uncharacterized protein LOC118449309 [Vespa mandarinia]